MLKELLDGIAWETVLRDMGMEQNWQLFKDAFLRAREHRGGRKLLQLSKDLLVRLRVRRTHTFCVEASMGGLGRLQEYHPKMYGCDQENQGADGSELDEGCEK